MIVGEPGGALVALTRSGLENAIHYFKKKWIREMESAKFGDFLVSGKTKDNPLNFLKKEENYELRYSISRENYVEKNIFIS